MDAGKNGGKEQVEESWIPKTPFKPILPKPPIVYTDEQGYRISQGQVKRLRSSGGPFETWSACSNGNWEIALPTKPGTNDQVLNGNFTSLLALQDQASAVLNGDYQLRSDGLWSHNFRQNSQDGIGISRGPTPDLNLLPGETEESVSHKTTNQMAPLTPGKKTPGAEPTFSQIQQLCTNDQELAKNSFGIVSEVITENGNNIGPCETPQQKPRRRKHRPKVITEGKARPRKPATPKPATPAPNPTGRRKYVRKTPLEQCKGSPTGEASKPANYTCRRSLNFETDIKHDKGSQLQPKDVGGWCKSKVTVDFGRGVEVMVGPECDLGRSIDQMRRNYDSLTPKQPPATVTSLPGKRAPSEPLAAAQKRKRNGECQNKPTEIILYTATQLPPRRTNGYNWENRRTEWANYNYSNQQDSFSTNTAGIYYNAVYAFEALNRQNSTASSTSCVTSLTSSKGTAKQETKGFRRSNIQSSSSISTQVEGPTKKRSRTPTIARQPPMSYNVHQAEILVSSLTQKLQQLDINRETSATLVPYSYSTINEQQNALVLYGRDGTLVPFQPIRRRQPRPKVDLDQETGRVWRLLLENINSQGIDGTDEEKAKWWKEERDVFSGRANSFIARMHLVQGDRRFTPWKGSVVDSVVGVFLTQNVSDHLSSSAFMSMAANFPLKSTSKEKTEEPIVCFPDLEYPINDMSNQSICDQSSVILHDSEPDEEKEADFSNRSMTNDVISSQNSVVSSQNSADSPGDSDNNAETNQMDRYNTFTELLMMAGRKELHKDLSIVEKSETQGENNNLSGKGRDIVESGSTLNILEKDLQKTSESDLALKKLEAKRKSKGRRVGGEIRDDIDWDALKKEAESNGRKRERTPNTMDSLDWEAVRCADVSKIADTIKERGMNNVLAGRIKDFLNRLVTEHGSIDLEWLRDVPPDKAKDYLLTIRGLGLKSVECVRLLTLHHLAFPVDVNVGRIAVRLGWVPLQPLPESLQLHLLELYPVQESIQKYLWPRLCKLDQKTLYELHYQLITFGKVFCTKSKPNCNACPMRGECRHFASAFASARLALPGPEDKSIVSATESQTNEPRPTVVVDNLRLPLPQPIEKPEKNRTNEPRPTVVVDQLQLSFPQPIEKPEENLQLPVVSYQVKGCEPIVEEPASPEPECSQVTEIDIEDTFLEDPDEIPTIKLDIEEFTHNLQTYMQNNMELQEDEMSKALVALTQEAASIPMPKLKNVSRLRTEHHVYELPDSHPLLEGLERREADDPCSYLLAIWTPGETANSSEPPESTCNLQEHGKLCDEKTCFSCNSVREANSQIVRGTLLIPCRTAMRGSFPLNGTYFQVNEVFADHDSSLNPIDVPRSWLWNLPRRTVYFGTSIPTIFKGLTTEGIQHCFWRGYVCVRGFDQKTRAPRPLLARLHFPASKLNKAKGFDRTE